MAQYYNFVTNTGTGTLTIEDVQRLCSVEGQSVQLVVEDVNAGGGGGGGNGTQQFLTYTAATAGAVVAQTREQTLFSQQINLGSQITGTHLEQGQNVFIIKTNDVIRSPNVLRSNTTNTQVVTENIVDIVDNKGSKIVGCSNERKQTQWMKMEENNIHVEPVKQNTIITEKSGTLTLNRSQLLNNTGLSANLHGRTGSSNYTPLVIEKKPRIYQSRPRHSLGGVATATVPTLTTFDRLNTGTTDTPLNRTQNVNTPSNNKSKTPVGVITPNVTARGQRHSSFIENTSSSRASVPSTQMPKTPLRLQPEMEHLSERIKKERMKQQTPPHQQQQLHKPETPRSMQNAGTQRQQQSSAASNNPKQCTPNRTMLQQKQQQQQQQLSTLSELQKQKMAMQEHMRRQTTPRVSPPPLATREVPDHMEVDSTDIGSSPEKSNQPPSLTPDTDADSNMSESYAYFQETIDDPSRTIVQHQIKGNVAKMLVMLTNGEQRLITFDIPNEDCTVQDLLEQVNIQFCHGTNVSLVSDPALGINYIVEAGIGSMISQENNDPNEANSLQENINPHETSHSQVYQDENSNSSVSQNEEPLYYEGKLAVCPNCGISSYDFNQCQRCKKKLPKDVKTIPDTKEKKENMLSVDNTPKKNNNERTERMERTERPERPERTPAVKLEKPERDGTPATAKRGRGRGRGGTSKARPVPKEPECLTISSDEEEEGKHRRIESMNNNIVLNNASNSLHEEMETILEKEPVITNNYVPSHNEQNVDREGSFKGGSREGDSKNVLENIQPLHTALLCRTVRIGSYKYVPREKVLITQSGVRFVVPVLEDDTSFVTMDVKMQDIVKVLIHFGKAMPVLFFYTCTTAGATIRELLGMQDPKGPYYDPAGKDHTHKRITLLPEKLSEESKIILKNVFNPQNLLVELSGKEANDILVRASPKDSVQVNSLTRKSGSTASGGNSQMDGGIQTITVYPPPPAKGGIAINTEDYLCLGEDQFLNDVIIDFYLKYLTLEVLSERDQKRTHVFSSYFYKRLTSPHASASESNLTPAAKRHARVQKWTKNVNIFEKDFIIIPINEHAHWFLAIICFPGLVGRVPLKPCKETKEDETNKIVQKSKRLKDLKLQAVTIGSTTITPVTTTITLDQADDGSERDEAEGDEEEMEMESDDEDENETQNDTENPPENPPVQNSVPSSVPGKDIVEVPSILIFDSLAGASRARVVATLRDYLSCEYVAKMGVEKTFSKDTIRGACPKVPQQSNFTDCGLYVLQYVESFFKNPIQDYTYPIKTLKNWFEEIVVTRKREELSQLLMKLVNETKGDRTINLPVVNFPTQDGKLKPRTENNAELKTPVKPEIEIKKKSSTGETTEPRTVNIVTTPSTNSESSNSEGVSKTTYHIIPSGVVQNITSPDATNAEVSSETKIYQKSSSETMSYLKSKRIPRLMSKTENQDDTQAAKKHKGETFESCK